MKINLNKHDDWKRPLTPGFDTPRLRVRLLEPSAMPDMISMIDMKMIYEFVPDICDGIDAREWFISVYRKTAYLFHSVTLTHQDGLAGFLMFNRDTDHRIYIGGCIAPSLWNQGIATELLTGLTHFLSEIRYKHPLLARVHPENTAVQTALQKSGFIASNISGVQTMTDYIFRSGGLSREGLRN